MCITRLRAYGEKWLLWSRKNQNTSMKSVIPVNKRDRTVIRQEMLGTYHIAQAFFDEHERMRLTLAPAAQPPPRRCTTAGHSQSPTATAATAATAATSNTPAPYTDAGTRTHETVKYTPVRDINARINIFRTVERLNTSKLGQTKRPIPLAQRP